MKNSQLKLQIQSAYIGKTIGFVPNKIYSQILDNGRKASKKWKVNYYCA